MFNAVELPFVAFDEGVLEYAEAFFVERLQVSEGDADVFGVALAVDVGEGGELFVHQFLEVILAGDQL